MELEVTSFPLHWGVLASGKLHGLNASGKNPDATTSQHRLSKARGVVEMPAIIQLRNRAGSGGRLAVSA